MSRALTRRQLFGELAKGACTVGVVGLGLGVLARQQAEALPAQALRPPGALSEGAFLGACVRCGLCVEACPYHTLKLARWFEPVTTGTPWFSARAIPCEMCDDIPCVKACPSGALSPELEQIDQARMGVAVLIDHETCLNALGLRCDVCYRVCPLIDQAITLDLQHNARTGKHAIFLPTVHSDVCTGCGKCEHACVLEEAAIKVLPRQLAKGELGHHYRLGWEEKAKAGKALIDEPLTLPVRRPGEGQ
ncbi:ferredoxin-type protein NapG [Aeromonas sp. RU39B]|uniref:ferredoxin-type protein NapG n=1 Tax=Aeromonas sp. RU39B TaxID=1907416 RepID=UPI0009542936|nr:ferredoxin-type protein NapG [Aeromonas sp. RU39B]SIQ14894.1 ferredoxin-type protein NapG [Aeromonas sp. RU39B]